MEFNESTKSLIPSEAREREEKRLNVFLVTHLTQLGMAIDQPPSDEKILLYRQGLADLSEDALKHGFDEALRHLGSFLPTIQQLREWSEAYRPTEPRQGRKFASVSDIDPAKCPAGWTPEQVFAAHLTQEKLRAEAHQREDDRWSISVSELRQEITNSLANKAPMSAQTRDWLEAGREAQKEYQAKLEADPEWQAMRERLGGVPGFKPPARSATEGMSAEEKRTWAKAKAIENGWCE